MSTYYFGAVNVRVYLILLGEPVLWGTLGSVSITDSSFLCCGHEVS